MQESGWPEPEFFLLSPEGGGLLGTHTQESNFIMHFPFRGDHPGGGRGWGGPPPRGAQTLKKHLSELCVELIRVGEYQEFGAEGGYGP